MKVIKSDLSAMNSSVPTSIYNAIEPLKNLKESISEFISVTPNYLKGPGYDAVRSKLSLYINAIEKQIEISQNLSDSITAANNTMINYMEEFSELDDSKTEETRTNLNKAKRHLIWFKFLRYGTLVDDELYNYYVNLIASYEADIERLERLLKKLENLGSTDSRAYSIIESIEGVISTYEGVIEGIQQSDYKI